MGLNVSLHNYGTTSTAAVLMPQVRIRPVRYLARAVGGWSEAEFEATGSLGALLSLQNYLHYGIRVTNEQGNVCWNGELSSVSVNTSTRTASLKGTGWWFTLDRRQYSNPTGVHAFYNSTGERHNLSEGTGITHLAQSFALTPGVGASFSVYTIGLNIYVSGTRADDLLVEVRTDSGGSPSATTVTSGVITASTVASTQGYVECSLGAPFTVDTTTSWIVVSCYGSPNASNFYQLGINATDGYSNGLFKWYKPSAWTAGRADTGKACDMQFKLLGQEETTTQIKNALTSSTYNENFTGVDILDASGIVTCQYRPDERSLQEVVEEMLDTGTANQKRLLARVNENRRIRIFEEPANTSPWLLSGALELGVNLDTVQNSVKIIYTTQSGASNTTGSYEESGYTTNDVSVARYGTFESRETANDTNVSAVSYRAQSLVNQKGNPIAELDFAGDAPIQVSGPTGAPIRRDTCPVGYWARIAATGLNVTEKALIGASNLVFIEEAEYNVERDEYIPRPRGQPDRMSVQIVNG